jgi:hypothetical protein
MTLEILRQDARSALAGPNGSVGGSRVESGYLPFQGP